MAKGDVSIEPAEGAFLIAPSNTNTFPKTRAVSIAATGILQVQMASGNILSIPDGALAAGIMHPLQIVMVYATATTATGIVGYY